mmetsp:Transcript_67218/g.151991  ORF Transcript_67218/g.151991 Transcript_67218/m.151991 type:complete len:467 (-) Transcript_67218:565-1965(-)
MPPSPSPARARLALFSDRTPDYGPKGVVRLVTVGAERLSPDPVAAVVLVHHGRGLAVLIEEEPWVLRAGGRHREVPRPDLAELELGLLRHGAQPPHRLDRPLAKGHRPRLGPVRAAKAQRARLVARGGPPVPVVGVEEPVVHRLVHRVGRRALGAEPGHLVIAAGDGGQVAGEALPRPDRAPRAEDRLIPVIPHHFLLVLLPKAVADAPPREPVIVIKPHGGRVGLLEHQEVGRDFFTLRGPQVGEGRPLERRVFHVAHQHPPCALGAGLDPAEGHLVPRPLENQAVVVLRARAADVVGPGAAQARAPAAAAVAAFARERGRAGPRVGGVVGHVHGLEVALLAAAYLGVHAEHNVARVTGEAQRPDEPLELAHDVVRVRGQAHHHPLVGRGSGPVHEPWRGLPVRLRDGRAVERGVVGHPGEPPTPDREGLTLGVVALRRREGDQCLHHVRGHRPPLGCCCCWGLL